MPRSRFKVHSDHFSSDAAKVKAVRFSNGLLNRKNSEDVDLSCFTSTDSMTSKKSIVQAKLQNMTYVGKNFGDANRFPTDSYSYSIAVHNKKTGKVRVLPVDLFQLEPWFEEKSKEGDTNSSFREKTDALVKEFGSGKSQRAVNQRLRNKMEDDMVTMTTKSVVDSAHTQSQSKGPSAATNESRTIPPHNIDATTPDDVYKLKDLISQSVMQSLEQPSRIFNSCTTEDKEKWREDNTYPSFVLQKLENLSDFEDARLLQCQLLTYIRYLFHVFHFKYNNWRLKYPCPEEWPRPAKDHILSLFAVDVKEPGKRAQRKSTPQHKDLLLSHILVLCLKLSDFSLELSPIAADLKLSMQKLCLHSKAIGCKVSKSKTNPESFVALLSVPVTFPVVERKSAKKRIF